MKLTVFEAQEIKEAGQPIPEMVTSMLWHPAPLCSTELPANERIRALLNSLGNVQPKLNPHVPNFPMKVLKCLSSSLRGGLFTGRVTHELTAQTAHSVQICEIR